MRPNDMPSLRTFLYNRDRRYIDSLLWTLHHKSFTRDFNSIGIKEDIDNCLRAFERQFNYFNTNLSEVISECLDECEALQISTEYLDWLDPKDRRQCNFIWLELCSEKHFDEVTMLSSHGNSNKHAIIIKALDRSSQSNTKKLKLITELRLKWKYQTSYKGFHYDWLSEKNQLQCEKALKYLYKPPSDKSKCYAKPGNIWDSSELSNYYNFLATIDCWSASLSDKEYFHEKIKDAARKWNTEKPKLKAKKNNNIVKVTDSKSLTMLEEITKRIGAKNAQGALKALILEKHATLSTPQSQENDEELRLNNDSTESDNYTSPQEHSDITSKLEETKRALEQLEEKLSKSLNDKVQ